MREAKPAKPPLTEDQQKLVMENCFLVEWTLREMSVWPRFRARLRQDLLQAGRLGLCEAARDYDPARGHFAAIATRMIQHSIVREIRVNMLVVLPYWHFRATARESWARNLKDRGNRILLANPTQDPALLAEVPASAEGIESPEFRACQERLHAEIERLPPGARAAIELHLRGYDQTEIGRELGIHPKAAENRRRRAIAALLKTLGSS